jgi:hypothetical protein
LLQAQTIAKALGLENMAIAEYPGVPMTDSPDELRRKVEGILINNIREGLSTAVKESVKEMEPEPKDVIFKGSLEEVNRFFYQELWTDGLPIIPPTIQKTEEFLKFTDRSPDEIIGVLMPENREGTIWNVAVNGVMAGCRPEYMPILIAVVEAIAEPEFRLEDAGSTPGWEPLIILNGPIIKELDFNFGAGVMRVGRQANTSVGRFLRLYMRNIAGLRIAPGTTDKGCIASTFNVVLAENEDAVEEIGWEPFSVDRGFERGENIVTVQSVVGISPPTYSGGNEPVDHMKIIADVIGERMMARWTYLAIHFGGFSPLFVLSPSIAKVIGRGGWSKDEVRKYLYSHAKVSAGFCERLAWSAGLSSFNFCDCVKRGLAPEAYCKSADSERMVPVFPKPECIELVVSGDPDRNQSRGYAQNHVQGAPVSKRINLPANWPRIKKSR